MQVGIRATGCYEVNTVDEDGFELAVGYVIQYRPIMAEGEKWTVLPDTIIEGDDAFYETPQEAILAIVNYIKTGEKVG